MATRKACGLALAKLGYANDRVVVLDSDTKNYTFSEIFKKEHPKRFIECFVAEQNMVSVCRSLLSLLDDHQDPLDPEAHLHGSFSSQRPPGKQETRSQSGKVVSRSSGCKGVVDDPRNPIQGTAG